MLSPPAKYLYFRANAQARPYVSFLYKRSDLVKTLQILCVIAGAITDGFVTVGKANVQKALLFLTALYSKSS